MSFLIGFHLFNLHTLSTKIGYFFRVEMKKSINRKKQACKRLHIVVNQV